MRHPGFRLALLLALALPAIPAARADDAVEAMDRARQLYAAGDLKGAATELSFALREVDSRRRAQFVALFPPAPAGWTLEPAADDGAGQALAAQMMGGGVMVDRSYARADGAASIKAQLLADSPMVQTMAAMVTNPMLMQPGDRRVRLGSETAMLRFDAAAQSGEITLASGNLLIKLEGEGLADATVMTELLRRFDLARLRAAR